MALIAILAWFVYFLITKNQHAVADIEGNPCPILTYSDVRDAGVVFYGRGYFSRDSDKTIPHDEVNIYRQKQSTGSLDCFVALSDTRCDMTGPTYIRASNRQKTIYIRLLEGQTAVLQGNADHLTCTIPAD